MQWFDLLNDKSNKYIKQATKSVDFRNFFLPVLSEEKFNNIKMRFQKILEDIEKAKPKIHYDGDIEVHFYEKDQPRAKGSEPQRDVFPSHWSLSEVCEQAGFPPGIINCWFAKNGGILTGDEQLIDEEYGKTLEEVTA